MNLGQQPLLNRDSVLKALLTNGLSPEGAEFIADRFEDPRLRATMRRYVNETFDANFRVKRIVTPQKPKAYISGMLRKKVFERDAYRCKHCGDWHDLSVDHIMPESLGGTLDLDNLQTLCIRCNCRKNNRYVG